MFLWVAYTYKLFLIYRKDSSPEESENINDNGSYLNLLQTRNLKKIEKRKIRMIWMVTAFENRGTQGKYEKINYEPI